MKLLIYTPLRSFNAEQRRREEYGKPIEIGSDVWVGGGAIILAGVRIGSRAMIGAGSAVTRDVPEVYLPRAIRVASSGRLSEAAAWRSRNSETQSDRV